MTGGDALSEISEKFPVRDLTLNGVPETKSVCMREGACPQCGKTFLYWPAFHAFKRNIRRSHRHRYLCSWACCQAYDRAHETPLDKKIDELNRELKYLYKQAELPPDKREVKTRLDRRISHLETKLGCAMARKTRYDWWEEET